MSSKIGNLNIAEMIVIQMQKFNHKERFGSLMRDDRKFLN